MINNETKFTLPAIIGLIITTPLWLIGDMNNYHYVAVTSIPMFGGVLLSICFGLKDGLKGMMELRKTHPTLLKDQLKIVCIGVLIGIFPLVMFMRYVMDGYT